MPNEYAVNQADLTAVADAIRTKGGTSAPLAFPDGFVAAVEAIEAGTGGGDASSSDLLNLVNGTLTNFVAPEGTKMLHEYLFSRMTSLKRADLRNVETGIGSYCFQNCSSLEEVLMPNTALGFTGRIFLNCTSLKRFEYIGSASMYSSSPSIFEGCTMLEEVYIPNTNMAGTTQMFKNCVSLRKFTTNGNRLGQNMFNGCTVLDKIIVKNSNAIMTLDNVNAFAGTPFAAGGAGGTIYVASALIEQYKTATNWVTLYNAGTVTFMPTEGSEYE